MPITATKTNTKTIKSENGYATTTENGALAFNTTKSACVDFFNRVGSERGNLLKGDTTIIKLFEAAYKENAEVALRTLFWARDARQGAGERSVFRGIIHEFAKTNADIVNKNLDLFPRLGRWDDLFALMGTPSQDEMLNYILHSLDTHEDRNLLAKWVPRSKVKDASKRLVFNILASKSGLGKGGFRRKIAKLSSTVEQKMCANEWSQINYESVPSKAQSKYVKAFYRNDQKRYTEFINAVNSGEKAINTSTLMPHEIVRMTRRSDQDNDVANTMWNNLEDVLPNTDEVILPVTDVSGSMSASIDANTSPIDVAVALSIYFAENNKGPIQNMGITFSSVPKFYHINPNKNLDQKVRHVMGLEWGMSTNLELVFSTLLKHAKKDNLSQEQMPSIILIMSDMQFDTAVDGNVNQTLYENIREQYADAGYKAPKVIFWNLNSRSNFPVQYDDFGTALISGFSPNIMRSVLNGNLDNLTPLNIMLETVMEDRYNVTL